jgi:hypothetical protein
MSKNLRFAERLLLELAHKQARHSARLLLELETLAELNEQIVAMISDLSDQVTLSAPRSQADRRAAGACGGQAMEAIIKLLGVVTERQRSIRLAFRQHAYTANAMSELISGRYGEWANAAPAGRSQSTLRERVISLLQDVIKLDANITFIENDVDNLLARRPLAGKTSSDAAQTLALCHRARQEAFSLIDGCYRQLSLQLLLFER